MNNLFFKLEKTLKNVNNRVFNLKTRINYEISIQKSDIQQYLKAIYNKFVLPLSDKEAKDVAIICKKYYAEVILKELGVTAEGNNTYCKNERNSN